MKKIFYSSITFINIITIIIIITGVSLAQNSTPSATPKSPKVELVSTDAAELERIQKIKEMVAKKVKELKLVEKRGIIGRVKEVTNNTQITIVDRENQSRIIDIDELTKFQDDTSSSKSTSSGKVAFGISDIKSGDILSFIGLYNKDTKRMLARVVSKAKSIPLYAEGIVKEKDVKNFTFDIVGSSGKIKIINVQTSTKTQTASKNGNIKKSGYTKIKIGERVLAAGFEDPEDKNMINATRIIHFEDVSPSSEMLKWKDAATKEPTSTPEPTTSGKKVTPTE